MNIDDAYIFPCPFCQESLEVESDYIGVLVCPHCENRFKMKENKKIVKGRKKNKQSTNESSEKMSEEEKDTIRNPSKDEEEKESMGRKISEDFLENYDLYAECTERKFWSLLMLINAAAPLGGTVKEIQAIPQYLEEGEVVFAMASGIMSQTTTSNLADWGANTWLVLLTSERFLFLDAALFGSSVDTQSVRHRMVQAVSASQGLLLGKLTIDLGSRLIVVDNCQKAHVKIMADLANKWLREIERRESKSSNPVPQESPLDKLAKLHELHSLGALSDEEFTTIKEKFISEM